MSSKTSSNKTYLQPLTILQKPTTRHGSSAQMTAGKFPMRPISFVSMTMRAMQILSGSAIRISEHSPEQGFPTGLRWRNLLFTAVSPFSWANMAASHFYVIPQKKTGDIMNLQKPLKSMSRESRHWLKLREIFPVAVVTAIRSLQTSFKKSMDYWQQSGNQRFRLKCWKKFLYKCVIYKGANIGVNRQPHF